MAGLNLKACSDGLLVIEVVNSYARDWLETRKVMFEKHLPVDVRFKGYGEGDP